MNELEETMYRLSKKEIDIINIEGIVSMYNKYLDTYGIACTIHDNLKKQNLEVSKDNILKELSILLKELEG